MFYRISSFLCSIVILQQPTWFQHQQQSLEVSFPGHRNRSIHCNCNFPLFAFLILFFVVSVCVCVCLIFFRFVSYYTATLLYNDCAYYWFVVEDVFKGILPLLLLHFCLLNMKVLTSAQSLESFDYYDLMFMVLSRSRNEFLKTRKCVCWHSLLKYFCFHFYCDSDIQRGLTLIIMIGIIGSN